jgi:manganese/zinc/iron transport system permease protein
MSVGLMDALLTVLIVLVVTTGLQTVGVVLMAAMLITPAAAARQWTDKLLVMLALAGVFGALAGASGVLASSLAPRMPTGPWIVMAITFIFAISITFAPKHGMLARWWRHRSNAQRINLENVLLTLYRCSEEGSSVAVSLDMIRRYRQFSVRYALRLLALLEEQGMVAAHQQPDQWRLTKAGIKRGKRLVRRHRLWELYLSRYLHLDKKLVHADAENIEHIITPELEAELETMLDHPVRDPHNKPIPSV